MPVARPILLALAALVATPLMAQSRASEWNAVRPGGETGCAFGTPFEFWIREGDRSRILIYLQGGGACWSLESCDPRRSISFDAAIDSTDYRQRKSGIFDRAASNNPFKDYTQVFVPYCTGDFHLGAREVSYPPGAGDSLPGVTVRHLGIRNLESVLGWLSQRRVRPGEIVVSGGSAGAIASPLLAGRVAEGFPSARIIQIGDGVAGIHNVKQAKSLMAVWGADSVLRSAGVPLDSDTDLFTAMYRTIAARHPSIHFSQIARDSDLVIAGWLRRFGYDPAAIPANIRATYDELTRAGLCFNGYQIPGNDHTILWRPEFLTARTDRGSLVDQFRREVLESPCSTKGASRGGDAAFLFSYRPKPEHADSFVAGYRRHLEWHAEHRDSLTWLAWNVVDGPEQGLFVDGTFGIAFAAFDARVEPGADAADFIRNVSPHIDPVGREAFRLRPDLSSGNRLEENRAGKLSKVVRFTVKPGELSVFEQEARIVRRNSGADYAMYERVSGGQQNQFLLVMQLNGWADLTRLSRDPSASLVRLSKSVLQAESSIWSYQSDLTYTPRR